MFLFIRQPLVTKSKGRYVESFVLIRAKLSCLERLSQGKSCFNANQKTLSKDLELIHVTKTGGTSLEAISKEQGLDWGYEKREKIYRNLRHTDKNTRQKCEDAEWHLPQYLFTEDPYESNTKDTFIVVRNPYERMISEYRWEVGYYKKNMKTERKKNKKFYDFVEKIGGFEKMSTTRALNEYLKEKLRKTRQFCTHYREQATYLFHPKEKQKLLVDHVLRFEDLDSDFDVLRGLYKISGSTRNVRKQQPIVDFSYGINDLLPETKELIYNFYLADFLVFGYKK
eukprot:snap_masked-scaffold_43-processed-gene-0.28-mRNA-1 protein AED:1.00 eAED:1.00 QI:0/0/0/0/1/1/2/0/282